MPRIRKKTYYAEWQAVKLLSNNQQQTHITELLFDIQQRNLETKLATNKFKTQEHLQSEFDKAHAEFLAALRQSQIEYEVTPEILHIECKTKLGGASANNSKRN